MAFGLRISGLMSRVFVTLTVLALVPILGTVAALAGGWIFPALKHQTFL